MNIKRLLSVAVACLCVLCSVTPAFAAYYPPFDVKAKAIYMVNLDTDKVIYMRNPQENIYPASITKIMTAILVLENVDDLDEETATYKMAFQDALYNSGASTGGLTVGEQVTIRGLLYEIMLASAAEAALMLADYVGDGSIPYFIEMMNEKAQEIGAENTHFANPHGLHDPENYSTAYDIYLITRYAMEVPGFMQIATSARVDIGPMTSKHNDEDGLVLSHLNRMMNKDSQYYYGPVAGIKTGTLDEAGRCLVSTASRDGCNYLLVLMGAPQYTDKGVAEMYNFLESEDLYEWAFETFESRKVVERSKAIAEIPVRLSSEDDHVTLVAQQPFTTLVPVDAGEERIQYICDIPAYIDAPVERGQEVGVAHVLLDGEELGQVPLMAGNAVSRSLVLFLWDETLQSLQFFWVKFVFILTLTLVLMYVFIMVVRNRGRRQYPRSRSGGQRFL